MKKPCQDPLTQRRTAMQKSKRKKQYGGTLPAAYRGLTDDRFELIVYMIEKVIPNIRIKRILRDPDDRRQTSFGLVSRDGIIWISRSSRHRKKQPPVKILIHEVLHHIYTDKVPHYFIYREEKKLWGRFTEKQQRFLRQYIPKHAVKSEPQL